MKTACAAVMLGMLLGSPLVHADRAVPFKPGEVLAYNVSWSNVVTAGSATLAVRERRAMGGGRSAYYIVAEAKPSSFVERLYHLYYKVETFLDTETLRPSHATVYSDERGRTRLRTTSFLPGNLANYEVKTATVMRSQVPVAPLSQDPLSALYVLRSTPLTVGQSVAVPFVTNGRSYRLRGKAEAREPLDTAIGRVVSWRIAVSIDDDRDRPGTTRDLTVWLSDDGRRLPLRLQVDLPVGSFRLTLARVGAR